MAMASVNYEDVVDETTRRPYVVQHEADKFEELVISDAKGFTTDRSVLTQGENLYKWLSVLKTRLIDLEGQREDHLRRIEQKKNSTPESSADADAWLAELTEMQEAYYEWDFKQSRFRRALLSRVAEVEGMIAANAAKFPSLIRAVRNHYDGMVRENLGFTEFDAALYRVVLGLTVEVEK